MTGPRNWYVLVVPAQKEYVAAYLLEKVGAHVYVPTETRWRRKNRYARTKVEFAFPVAPRYVFAGFAGPVPWHRVFSVSLVKAVIAIGGVPRVIDDAAMARFRARIPNGRLTIETVEVRVKGGRTIEKGVRHRIVSEAHAPAEQRFMASGKEFSAGDAVEIVDGPFRDRFVTVEEIKGPMATIMLELFGEQRAVEVPVKHLEKAA